MAWTYVDPSGSDRDRYRFFIGDTDAEEPILQDEEVDFVLGETDDHFMRMYMLFEAATLHFARQIENKVGPIEEKPQERMRYFRAKAKEYYNKAHGLNSALPSGKCINATFRVGMHDNG